MAAPTKLSPGVQETICKTIAAGNYREPACALAGIGLTTFHRWMAEGEQAKSGAKREFWEAVTRAEAEAEERVVALWQARIPDDWQAARDFLARRHPERWGRTVQDQRHTGKDGTGPVVISYIEAAPPHDPAALRDDA